METHPGYPPKQCCRCPCCWTGSATAIRDGGSAVRDHQPVPDLLGWAEGGANILNFNHPLDMDRQLKGLGLVNGNLGDRALSLRQGSIVDVTLI